MSMPKSVRPEKDTASDQMHIDFPPKNDIRKKPGFVVHELFEVKWMPGNYRVRADVVENDLHLQGTFMVLLGL